MLNYSSWSPQLLLCPSQFLNNIEDCQKESKWREEKALQRLALEQEVFYHSVPGALCHQAETTEVSPLLHVSHKVSWLSQADGRKGQNLNYFKWNCASLHKPKILIQLLWSPGRQVQAQLLSGCWHSHLQHPLFSDVWWLQSRAACTKPSVISSFS